MKMLIRHAVLAALFLVSACASAPQRVIDVGDPVTAFRNVTVVTEYGGERLARHTVVVRGDRIIAIAPDDRVSLPESATVIDGAGRLLAPGVADMHVHYQDPSVGVLMLANSITTIRNPSGFGGGNGPGTTLDLAARTVSGEVVGPYVYSSGQLIDGPGSFWGPGVVVESVEGVRERVRQDAEAGYIAIKLYAQLTPEQFRAGVEEARAHNLQIYAHVPASMTLDEVLDLPVDSIEHLDGYERALGGEGQGVQARWQAAQADLVAPLAQRVSASGVWQVPTLIVHLAPSRAFVDINAADAAPELRYAQQGLLDFWHSYTTRIPPGTDLAARYRVTQQAHTRRIEMLRALRQARAPLLIGTDAPNPYVMYGFAIHEELGFFSEAGFSNTEILRIATLDAARFLDKVGEFGVIREGARADFVLLAGDPERDLGVLRAPQGVMAAGHWYDRARLDALLSETEQSAAQSRVRPAQ
ncbi:amidohydrolase family protein [Terricaulis sp.]|uniref:amidohydrolase family protein n=1 Tax=Terricaulis sp. TaxID=2768686 RepID=UPI002AC399DD|nr:amidohydrolase family protein [Terricaulis sp.]MDZ4692978.1 amidohydrolase family protein [Terricaulis sp.]